MNKNDTAASLAREYFGTPNGPVKMETQSNMLRTVSLKIEQLKQQSLSDLNIGSGADNEGYPVLLRYEGLMRITCHFEPNDVVRVYAYNIRNSLDMTITFDHITNEVSDIELIADFFLNTIERIKP